MSKKLYRSVTDRKVAGVCGGLAECWEVDSSTLRLIVFVLIFLTDSLFFWLYLVATVLIPEKGKDSIAKKIASQPFEKTVKDFEAGIENAATNASQSSTIVWLGGSMITLGVFFLVRPFLPNWVDWSKLVLAIVLIISGTLLLTKKGEVKNDQSK